MPLAFLSDIHHILNIILSLLLQSIFLFRCYFIYRLVEGLSSSDEVAKNIRPKLIVTLILSVIYDLPRLYLNVNLFGSLCTFYYNIIQRVIDSITYRAMKRNDN